MFIKLPLNEEKYVSKMLSIDGGGFLIYLPLYPLLYGNYSIPVQLPCGL